MKGLLAIPSFVLKNDKNNILKTYITQEMLKKDLLLIMQFIYAFHIMKKF